MIQSIMAVLISQRAWRTMSSVLIPSTSSGIGYMEQPASIAVAMQKRCAVRACHDPIREPARADLSRRRLRMFLPETHTPQTPANCTNRCYLKMGTGPRHLNNRDREWFGRNAQVNDLFIGGPTPLTDCVFLVAIGPLRSGGSRHRSYNPSIATSSHCVASLVYVHEPVTRERLQNAFRDHHHLSTIGTAMGCMAALGRPSRANGS